MGAGSGDELLVEGGSIDGAGSETDAVGSVGVQDTNASRQNADQLKSAVVFTFKYLLKSSRTKDGSF